MGIVATDEERDRLEREYHGLKNIKFRTGLVQKLPLEDGVATKTICNSVLLLLDSETEVRQSIIEISRISKRGAFVWIGEIPEINEFKPHLFDMLKKQQFRYVYIPYVLYLYAHILKKRQFTNFISTTKKKLRFRLQNKTIRMALNAGRSEERSKSRHLVSKLFFIRADDFIGLAETCGLRLRWHGKHKEIDISGNVYDSPTRNDFFFLRE